ncbi:MAG: hypothetical protein AAFR39_14385 [Pseudomonadota bacterium]
MIPPLIRIATFSTMTSLALTGAVSAEVLTGPAIAETVSGQTLKTRRAGLTMRLTLNGDGSATGRMGPLRQSGSWSVESDQLCIDMPRRPSDVSRCQTITRIDANQLQGSSGAILTIE